MTTLSLLCVIGVGGFLCQWASWKTKQPSILYLLVLGLVLGPATGFLDADAVFGELLFPIVSFAVAIILFEGSLTLRLQELKDIASPVIKMVSWGALINASITAVAVYFFLDFNWSLAALFGAIMVVTGPTVIIPILRVAKPTTFVSRVLRWEGIVIDPVGALLAVLVFEWISVGANNEGIFDVGIVFVKTIALGCIVGVVSAFVFGNLLKKNWIPEYLQNYAAVSFVVFALVFANSVAHESGLLAVTIMGLWLTNMPGVHTRDILVFKENLTTILVSIIFIILAARVEFSGLLTLGGGAIAVMLVIQFISRPVKVLLCLLGTKSTIKERLAVAWIGPRGIVAAAVSALFALKLQSINFPNAELLVPLTFSVIIGTVVIQSLSATSVCRLLKVRRPSAGGYLIIGANLVAREIGKSLQESGANVKLCDTSWGDINKARLEGLPCYYGNPNSYHADLYLDLTDYTFMLGLDYFPDTNTSAALRFKDEFGLKNIFSLQTGNSDLSPRKHEMNTVYKGSLLFDEGVNYADISKSLGRNEKIRKTTLSEKYGFQDWLTHESNENAMILFALDEKQKFIGIYPNVNCRRRLVG